MAQRRTLGGAIKYGASGAIGAGGTAAFLQVPPWMLEPLGRLGAELTISALGFAMLSVFLLAERSFITGRHADMNAAASAEQTSAIVDVAVATTKQTSAIESSAVTIREMAQQLSDMAHSVDRIGDRVDALERAGLLRGGDHGSA